MAGRVCTFSPRKDMGRPKNGERKRGRRSDHVPPSRSSDSLHEQSPLQGARSKQAAPSQAISNEIDSQTIPEQCSIAENDFLQDFAYSEPGSMFQERDIYQTSSHGMTNSNFTLNDLFGPCPMPLIETATSEPPSSQASTPMQPAMDLLTRLSRIQMALWRRGNQPKDTATKNRDRLLDVDIDFFFKTASDICGIAEAAGATSPKISSHDLELFNFQLMRSVTAALDILNPLEEATSAAECCGNELRNQDEYANSAPLRSSFFVLSSLKYGDILNTLLTFTTLDFYLAQLAAVLSNIDRVSEVASLRPGVEAGVQRCQRFRQLVSSCLQGLQSR